MQTEMKQAISNYKKLVDNVGMFEAQVITWANGPVHFEFLNKSPRELALQIEMSSLLGHKLCIAVSKNRQTSVERT